jgi:two-component system OmpR family sensor kinase
VTVRSLTARLVATSLILMALAIGAFGAATTVALRGYLMQQLDDEVVGTLARATRPRLESPGMPPPMNRIDGHPEMVRGQGIGTLTAIFGDDGRDTGVVLGEAAPGEPEEARVRHTELQVLRTIPRDGHPRTVELRGAGEYRAAALDVGPAVVVAGLPQSRVNDVVRSVVGWEAVLGILTLALSGALGAFLVRRNLAELHAVAATAHEVAALPLSEGAVNVAPRVANPDERTEIGQMGAALNALLSHVEASLEARHRSELQVRQFVADASHELRTPLSTIRGYAELATERPEDVDGMRQALLKVTGEAARMSSLVEDLLLLARLDAGRPLASEPVDLSRLTVEAVADARVLAPDHRWILEVGAEPVEVVGDEARLRQVIRNLVANARVHTPPGTTVTVAVEPGRLTVSDDGPGFDDADSALERFSRGDPARAAGNESVGLGLAIVDSIVRAHGGTVAIESVPGRTRVLVTL